MNSKIFKYALTNAGLTAVYVILVAIFLSNAGNIFGRGPDTVFIPVAMLLLFVFSAALTGSLVLGRPLLWYFDGKKAESVKLFMYTLSCLFALALIAFIVLFFAQKRVSPARTFLERMNSDLSINAQVLPASEEVRVRTGTTTESLTLKGYSIPRRGQAASKYFESHGFTIDNDNSGEATFNGSQAYKTDSIFCKESYHNIDTPAFTEDTFCADLPKLPPAMRFQG